MNLNTPINKTQIQKLHAGDIVKISGTIYAARDAAHKKLIELLDNGFELPFPIENQIIYYVGPCPERPGQVLSLIHI